MFIQRRLMISAATLTNQVIKMSKSMFIAELSCAKRASGAPWLRKFGKLSIR